MKQYYDSIFKRRSMRHYDETLLFTAAQLDEIEQRLASLSPLVPDIKVEFKIVKRSETTAKFGTYCLMMYSEQKPNYLLNAGYMLEQMDLWFASQDIGACWLGFGKTEQTRLHGLDFVIMLCFGKSDPADFRKGSSEFSRKDLSEIWQGEFDEYVKNAARLAPSACNTQSWRVMTEGNSIKVFRTADVKSFIPQNLIAHFNTIDLGIFLCFLETALLQKRYTFKRTLAGHDESEIELVPISTYIIG